MEAAFVEPGHPAAGGDFEVVEALPVAAGGGQDGRVPDELAQQLYDARDKSVQEIANLFGVPRSTVYGHLDRQKTVPRQPKRAAAKA